MILILNLTIIDLHLKASVILGKKQIQNDYY